MNEVIWYMGVVLIGMLFELLVDNSEYGMLTLLYFGALWVLPNSIWLGCYDTDRAVHSWEKEENHKNPLFVRGYFRKNKFGGALLPKLRGLWFIKVLGMILAGIMLIYEVIMHSRGLHFRDFEIMSMVRLGIIVIGYILCFLFYRWQYRMDFSYIENNRGIWQPFRYINPFFRRGYCESSGHLYDMEYADVKECTGKNCINKNYQFAKNYPIPGGGECVIYMLPTEQELHIFELIHIKNYSEEKMQELDRIFEEFWLEYVDRKCRTDSVSLIFLLCVEEYTAELRRRLLSKPSVFLKKGRYRLPAVLVFSEDSSLIIFKNQDVFYREKYMELRAELRQMIRVRET